MPEPSITTDDLWPRTALYRYRLYLVTDDSHEIIAAAPTPAGVGVALVQLYADEKKHGRTLSERGHFGLLDTCPDDDENHETGEWIIMPFPRGNHI